MPTKKNLPKVQVLELGVGALTTDVINAALLIRTTGDPVATTPPVTDTVLHGQASSLQTMYTGSRAKPPTFTTDQVATQRKIVANSYNKVVDYLKGVGNDAAIAAGDVTTGHTVVTRCGARLKKTGVKPPRSFGAESNEQGGADITTKSAGPSAIYRRQYGLTPTKGVPPTTLSDDIITREADVHLSNLQSAKVYGVREAIILPAARTRSSTTTTPGATTTKLNKPTFSDGASHYTFSGWIYVVIQ